MSSMSKSYESVYTAFGAYQRIVSSNSIDDVSQKLYIQFKVQPFIFFLFFFLLFLPNSHNTHHYLEFFKVIRQHIANDTLSALLTLIREQQVKYDAEQQLAKEQDEISNISADANSSPLKKVKNVVNDAK